MSAHSLSLPLFSVIQDQEISPELIKKINEKLVQLGLEKDISVTCIPSEDWNETKWACQWCAYSDLGIQVLRELVARQKEDE